MTRRRRISGLMALGALGAFSLAAAPFPEVDLAGAVVVSPRSEAPAFGTVDESILTLTAYDFQLLEGHGAELDIDWVVGTRRCASSNPSSCTFAAGLRLPSGARITEIELEGCDGSDSNAIVFSLYRHSTPAGMGFTIGGPGTTGLDETPGCALFPIATPVTVNNLNTRYSIVLSFSAGANVRFGGFRVRYQYQVSPAPLTATFGDVPTDHPQFQFIEALVKSGATAGCGGGNYCPGANLTRGQMAVFLAKLLGLHYPN